MTDKPTEARLTIDLSSKPFHSNLYGELLTIFETIIQTFAEKGIVHDIPISDSQGNPVGTFNIMTRAAEPPNTTSLTFERFQATRTECSDIGKALSDARWDDGPLAQGYLYLGQLYIEKVTDDWPEAARRQGAWALQIHNTQILSDHLESLERHLYDFAVSEGYDVED